MKYYRVLIAELWFSRSLKRHAKHIESFTHAQINSPDRNPSKYKDISKNAKYIADAYTVISNQINECKAELLHQIAATKPSVLPYRLFCLERLQIRTTDNLRGVELLQKHLDDSMGSTGSASKAAR